MAHYILGSLRGIACICEHARPLKTYCSEFERVSPQKLPLNLHKLQKLIIAMHEKSPLLAQVDAGTCKTSVFRASAGCEKYGCNFRNDSFLLLVAFAQLRR